LSRGLYRRSGISPCPEEFPAKVKIFFSDASKKSIMIQRVKHSSSKNPHFACLLINRLQETLIGESKHIISCQFIDLQFMFKHVESNYNSIGRIIGF